jgi:hypothetical protein
MRFQTEGLFLLETFNVGTFKFVKVFELGLLPFHLSEFFFF